MRRMCPPLINQGARSSSLLHGPFQIYFQNSSGSPLSENVAPAAAGQILLFYPFLGSSENPTPEAYFITSELFDMNKTVPAVLQVRTIERDL